MGPVAELAYGKTSNRRRTADSAGLTPRLFNVDYRSLAAKSACPPRRLWVNSCPALRRPANGLGRRFLTIILYRNMQPLSAFSPFPSRGGRGRRRMVRGETSRSPMERREAQHPGGRPRKPAAVAVRAPGGGPRNPVLEPRRADCPIARAVQRGLASPWRLPALHSPYGETEKGTGAPAPSKNRADDARLSVVLRRPARNAPSLETSESEIL